VLIVDDDADQRQILTTALEPHYIVSSAADGLDGYAMACTEPPDVIVLDIMMPVVDGWTMLRKLRVNPATRTAGIVVVTALDMEEEQRKELVRLNVAAVLRKPLDLGDVASAIARASRSSRA
jgi:CheY-like chemotaxis protein